MFQICSKFNFVPSYIDFGNNNENHFGGFLKRKGPGEREVMFQTLAVELLDIHFQSPFNTNDLKYFFLRVLTNQEARKKLWKMWLLMPS